MKRKIEGLDNYSKSLKTFILEIVLASIIIGGAIGIFSGHFGEKKTSEPQDTVSSEETEMSDR